MGTPAKKSLDQVEHDALAQAFLSHYLTRRPLLACLSEAGVATSTYYRWREAFPDEIEGIQGEAAGRAAAVARRKHAEFVSAQMDDSVSVQTQAREALHDAVKELARIARGEDREIEEGGAIKTIRTYPRDVIGAVSALREIATYGVLPEDLNLSLEERVESQAPPPFPGLTFSRVTAVTPGGDTVTLERGDVIEGEVIDEADLASCPTQ